MPPASGRVVSHFHGALATFICGEAFVEFRADDRMEVGVPPVARGMGSGGVQAGKCAMIRRKRCIAPLVQLAPLRKIPAVLQVTPHFRRRNGSRCR